MGECLSNQQPSCSRGLLVIIIITLFEHSDKILSHGEKEKRKTEVTTSLGTTLMMLLSQDWNKSVISVSIPARVEIFRPTRPHKTPPESHGPSTGNLVRGRFSVKLHQATESSRLIFDQPDAKNTDTDLTRLVLISVMAFFFCYN